MTRRIVNLGNYAMHHSLRSGAWRRQYGHTTVVPNYEKYVISAIIGFVLMSISPGKQRQLKKIPPSEVIAAATKKVLSKGPKDHVVSTLKAAVSLIPGIGGPLASLIGDYIPSRRDERIDTFIANVIEDLTRKQAEINELRILTDHYAYIFEQCFIGVSRCPHKEKIDCYRAILVNAATVSAVADDEQIYYLSLVERLTHLHIKLLSILNRASKVPQGRYNPDAQMTIQDIFTGIDKDVLLGLYSELESLHFTNTQADYFPSLINIPLEKVGGRINSAARKFIEFCTLT